LPKTIGAPGDDCKSRNNEGMQHPLQDDKQAHMAFLEEIHPKMAAKPIIRRTPVINKILL